MTDVRMPEAARSIVAQMPEEWNHQESTNLSRKAFDIKRFVKGIKYDFKSIQEEFNMGNK